jgi:GntR family transcriptional regulator
MAANLAAGQAVLDRYGATDLPHQKEYSVPAANGLPLYQQIAVILRSHISSRDWAPGEKIPSESELAAQYGVSIMTVRQALSILVSDGLLERHVGRGTFVSNAVDQPSVREAHLTASLSDVAAEMIELDVRPIDIGLARAPRWVHHAFGIPHDQPITRIRRSRHITGEPVSYTVSFLRDPGAGLTIADIAQPSLVALLEERLGKRFSDASQTIEATAADPEAAEILKLTAGSPLLLVQRTYHVQSGQAEYISIARYGSERFRYHVNLTRDKRHGDTWTIARPAQQISTSTG